MTPQDQEDHRLAALAAGLPIRFRKDIGCFVRMHNSCAKDQGFWGAWVPLANKSDSFDLMVACGIQIDTSEDDWHSATYWIDEMNINGFIYPPHDSQEAMKAIFRCAVEIGRAKEGKANAQN